MVTISDARTTMIFSSYEIHAKLLVSLEYFVKLLIVSIGRKCGSGPRFVDDFRSGAIFGHIRFERGRGSRRGVKRRPIRARKCKTPT